MIRGQRYFCTFFLRLCSGEVRHIQTADHPLTRKKTHACYWGISWGPRARKFGVVGWWKIGWRFYPWTGWWEICTLCIRVVCFISKILVSSSLRRNMTLQETRKHLPPFWGKSWNSKKYQLLGSGNFWFSHSPEKIFKPCWQFADLFLSNLVVQYLWNLKSWCFLAPCWSTKRVQVLAG